MNKFILFAISVIFISGNLIAQIWGPDTRLTKDTSESYFSFPTQWAIATDNRGCVHVVWYDQRDPQWCTEVYYKRSKDNGETWEADKPLTTNSSYWQEGSCIATDRLGRLHVVYTEFSYWDAFKPIIHYKRSTDGGDTWEAQQNIVSTIGDFAGHTSLASDLNDGVYVLFADQTGVSWKELDNYIIRSSDGGVTWEPRRQLTNSRAARWGSVAADTLGRVHIVYPDERAGSQIYYRRWLIGQPIEPEVILTTGNSPKWNPSVYTDRGDKVHIVWEDARDGNWEIYYIRSTDGGSTWGDETRLTKNPNESSYANIAADLCNRVYVVWQDNRDNADFEVYFKESIDGGNTWSYDTCITDSAVAEDEILFPNIACDDSGNYLHVAWKDKRDGNTEIYYKRRVGATFLSEAKKLEISGGVDIFPNPSPSIVRIVSHIPHSDKASITIYNAAGRIVRHLPVNGEVIYWNREDNYGKICPIGVYFIRVESI
ncbi:MAG: T9SS type A sorting domain-containing protein, partial [bacterium]|nr:T9SS type A sorting domain-containing protein [bacterium]